MAEAWLTGLGFNRAAPADVLIALLDAGHAGCLHRTDLPGGVLDAATVQPLKAVWGRAAECGRLSAAQWERLLAAGRAAPWTIRRRRSRWSSGSRVTRIPGFGPARPRTRGSRPTRPSGRRATQTAPSVRSHAGTRRCRRPNRPGCSGTPEAAADAARNPALPVPVMRRMVALAALHNSHRTNLRTAR
ncbi:hypothetical protein [Kitasatospora terrestris]|uniref:hypothetical protein n=1 Tax=Kitasatospora terrestris TaxID=258051 RepID=UPI0031EA4F6F